jgi:glycine/D-amino acid oxidase-like deaminating enzyme
MGSHRFTSDDLGWNRLLPDYQAKPSLRKNTSAPWTVIGAGFTGLACARRLAELHPQDRIVLLEARTIGQGASGRNSGFAVETSHFLGRYDSAKRGGYERVNRINRRGLDLLRGWVEKYSIDCDWQESGLYHCAADKMALAELEHYKGYLQALAIPHRLLDQSELIQRLGSAHYRAGIWLEKGALVQPAALVRGLLASLPDNIDYYERSAVRRVDHHRGITVHTDAAQIVTEQLLIASNYEGGLFGDMPARIVPSTLSGSFTRQLTDDELQLLGRDTSWGVLSLHGGGATVRLTRDQRICIRNCAEFNGGKLLNEAELSERQKVHRKAFELRFPQLTQVNYEFSWSGVEGITRNSTNLFTRLAANMYFAGGYNGSGISRGSAFGHALAEWASGDENQAIRDCMAGQPPQWVPPRPWLDLAAMWAVHCRFKGVGRDQ